MAVGELSVQAEILHSNKLASVTRRLVPSRELSRREIRNCPTASQLSYLFVLVRFRTPLERWPHPFLERKIVLANGIFKLPAPILDFLQKMVNPKEVENDNQCQI